MIEAGAGDAVARGEGSAIGIGEYAAAVPCSGTGRDRDALAASERAAGTRRSRGRLWCCPS
jgi:hypothetical protein